MEIFLAICRAGSLGRASRELNITQPAVSKAVRRLEDHLQVRLFERDPRGMIPTVYGEALRRHAELITSEMRNAIDEIDAMRGAARGRVKVGGTPSVIEGPLARAVIRLLEKSPDLHVEVFEALEVELLDALLKGVVDIAILGRMRRVREYPVIEETLYVDRVSVICRAGHPLTRKPDVALGDLTRYPWILTNRENVMWRRLAEVFDNAGMDPPEARIESASAHFMVSTAVASDFLTWLPETLVRQHIREGELTVLAPEQVAWQREVVALRRRKGMLARAAAALLAELRAMFRDDGQAPAAIAGPVAEAGMRPRRI